MIDIRKIFDRANLLLEDSEAKKKVIAFVPGSFKPPHKQHEETVAEYSKIADEVIVLISAPTKKPRLTNLGTAISPDTAKRIFELYIKADHLKNVTVEISDTPSPVTAVISYIDKHKDGLLRNSKLILGASTKDNDYKRWVGPFFDKLASELKEYNIEILDPQKTAIDHKTENLGASDMREHIDDLVYMQKFFPDTLTSKDRKAIFDMLNTKSESLMSEGGNMFSNTTRISQENTAKTIENIKAEILPLLKLTDKDVKILGSTGKKLPGGSSGDIDIGISYKTLAKHGVIDYKTFVKYASQIFSALPYESKHVSKYNIFSFSYPIANVDGKQPDSFVQVDLMPVDNLDMTEWGFYSPAEIDEKWKGAVRNQLIMKYAGLFDQKIIETADINGKEIPVVYEKYHLDRVKGLYRKTLNRLKPDGTLRAVPKVISSRLVTDDAKKIIRILFGNADFNKFYSTTGTWDEIKRTQLFKDKQLRSKMLISVKAELDRSHISYPSDFDHYIEPKVESICEGGRLFGDKVGRIDQENVQPTIDDLTNHLLVPMGLDDKHFAILGSTGKKLPGGSSGDIDVGIDLTYLKSKTEIKDYDSFKAIVEPMLDELNVEYRETGSRKMVSIVWPIANVDGKQPDSFVQVDLMPVDRLDMVKWGSYAPAEKDNPYKGMIRNELLRQYATIFKYKILKKAQVNGADETVEYSKYDLDIRFGLFEKTLSREGKDKSKLLKVPKVLKKQLITDDALKIVKILFGNNQTLDNFWTIDTTWEQFKKTDVYKNKELRDVVLAKCINEYNRNDVSYPPYMEAAMTDKSLLRKKEVILEGGKAIDNASRITQKNANATINALLKMLSSKLDLNIDAFAILGSAGKKAPNETSGDIDVGIDMKQTSFDDVKAFLSHANKILGQSYQTAFLSSLNTLSFGFPIENADGTQQDMIVQVDLMPALNFEMLKFGQYSPTYIESKYKGVVRNLLLTDIAGRAKFEVKKTLKDDSGKDVPALVTKYALVTSDGLYEKTFTKEGKNSKLLKTPKVLERHLVTNDVRKILHLIFTSDTKPEDCLTVDGVWEQFKKTDSYKDPVTRKAILHKTVNELEHRGLDYPSYLKQALNS